MKYVALLSLSLSVLASSPAAAQTNPSLAPSEAPAATSDEVEASIAQRERELAGLEGRGIEMTVGGVFLLVGSLAATLTTGAFGLLLPAVSDGEAWPWLAGAAVSASHAIGAILLLITGNRLRAHAEASRDTLALRW